MIRNLVKEPLVYFLLGAALLFSFTNFLWPEEAFEDDPMTIQIDQASLIEFMEYQSGVFDKVRAEKALRDMPSERREKLIERYVEEEVLYREALSMGLDKNDRAIRLRLVQQAATLAQTILSVDQEPSEEDILSYFDEHQQRYIIEPSVTFTHVFLDPKKYTGEQGVELRETLQKEAVPFDQSGQYGNRFLYHINYVERTPDFIAAHFGVDFSDYVFDEKTPIRDWVGPVPSVHGNHILLITKRTKSRVPVFDEVKGKVVADFMRDLQEELRAKNIKSMIDRYTIEINDVEVGQ